MVAVVIGGADPAVQAAAAGTASYVDRVLVYSHAQLGACLAETWAPVLVAAVKLTGASPQLLSGLDGYAGDLGVRDLGVGNGEHDLRGRRESPDHYAVI